MFRYGCGDPGVCKMNQFGSGRKMSLVGVDTSVLLPEVASVSGVVAVAAVVVLPFFNPNAFVSTLMGVIVAEASEKACEEAPPSPEETFTRGLVGFLFDVVFVGRHMVGSTVRV